MSKPAKRVQKHIKLPDVSPSPVSEIQFEFYPFITPSAQKDKGLLKAVIKHDIFGIEKALEKKANINTRNDELQTAIHIAVEGGSVKVLKKLLSYRNIKVNIRNQYGFTPLYIAAWQSNLEIVRILLLYGAKPNIKCVSRNTALHAAVSAQNYAIVKLLIQYGAKIEAVNCFGETPLKKAIELINIKITDFLLMKGAAVKSDPYLHLVHLVLAVIEAESFSELLERLIQHGTNINAVYEMSEKTLLHFSAMRGNVGIVNVLMKHGANPYILDAFEDSPLACAIDFRNHLAIAFFIQEMKTYEPNLFLRYKIKKMRYADVLK